MRSIHKSAEPQSLQVFRKAGHSDWSEIYDQCAYRDCLSQCVYDQGELDGYTEMVLDNTRHIDHYVCRRFDPKMTFRWTNMVAAVRDSRFGANYKDTSIKTVHYDKTNGRYLNLYNPVTDDMKDVFSYYSDGSICPSDKQDIKAGCTIEFFNLNEKSLKERINKENFTTEDIADLLLSRKKKSEGKMDNVTFMAFTGTPKGETKVTFGIKEVLKDKRVDSFDEETLMTVNKFFENSLNVSETSRQLYIHRNTLVYRLDKLLKTTGLDLRKFDDAIIFKITIMVSQYMDYMEKQSQNRM